MAEGFLRSLDPKLQVSSAGTEPVHQVHPKAIQVMKEVGVDLSTARPKDVAAFTHEDFDYVITVCDHAREACPAFIGGVQEKLHMAFEDPAQAIGDEDQILAVFRRVRDEIMADFREFYNKQIKPQETDMTNIKVLGPGCPNCAKLEKLCQEVVAENNIQAEVEKITDINRFADYGLLMTPGLVVNEKLVSSGKIPGKAEIMNWIRAVTE